jgi:hypothetical protein
MVFLDLIASLCPVSKHNASLDRCLNYFYPRLNNGTRFLPTYPAAMKKEAPTGLSFRLNTTNRILDLFVFKDKDRNLDLSSTRTHCNSFLLPDQMDLSFFRADRQKFVPNPQNHSYLIPALPHIRLLISLTSHQLASDSTDHHMYEMTIDIISSALHP